MKVRNSLRVRASDRNVPSILDVIIDTPRLWMPRVVMHSCAASITTPTPCGLQHVVDAAGDFGRHLFLHLEAAREDVDHAGQLADADDLAGRQVTHVGAADDRRHVVLAVRFELDVAQHDHLVVAAGLLERAAQVVARVDRVAGKPVGVGVDDALRRIEQAFASRVFAGPAQQRADGVLGCGPADVVASGDPWGGSVGAAFMSSLLRRAGDFGCTAMSRSPASTDLSRLAAPVHAATHSRRPCRPGARNAPRPGRSR